MDYWKLTKRAWYITGKYKFLWIFGLFLGGFSINSVSSFNNSYSNEINNSQDINFIEKGQELFFANLLIIGIITFIILVVILIMVCIKVISYSAVIAGVNEIEETGESNFSRAFKLGIKYFWKILALHILDGLFSVVLLIILGLPVVLLFILNMPLRGFVLGLLAFMIFLPLVILINFVFTYASRSIVINKNKLVESIKTGFVVFKDNILASFLISLILFAINMGVTIIVIITLLFLGLLFGIPMVLIGIILSAGAGIIGSILLIILGILLICVFFVFIGAIINTFQSTLWTLVYRELTHT
jgi:hypothetical protein